MNDGSVWADIIYIPNEKKSVEPLKVWAAARAFVARSNCLSLTNICHR